MDLLKNKRILVTGGTGSFVTALTKRLLEHHNFEQLVIYSRDEFKQYSMKNELIRRYGPEVEKRVTFFIGDVRDRRRMALAFTGIVYVINTDALKHVPIC